MNELVRRSFKSDDVPVYPSSSANRKFFKLPNMLVGLVPFRERLGLDVFGLGGARGECPAGSDSGGFM